MNSNSTSNTNSKEHSDKKDKIAAFYANSLQRNHGNQSESNELKVPKNEFATKYGPPGPVTRDGLGLGLGLGLRLRGGRRKSKKRKSKRRKSKRRKTKRRR